MGIPTVKVFKFGLDFYDNRNDYYFHMSCDKGGFTRL